jgi:hypothetical protein
MHYSVLLKPVVFLEQIALNVQDHPVLESARMVINDVLMTVNAMASNVKCGISPKTNLVDE